MRKITAGLFISLDGVVEAPDQWHFPWFNDEMGEIVGAQMAASDTMLLGRRTYEEFASYWPHQGGDEPFAAAMNETPKLVVSTTLERADWQNSTIVRGLEELRSIREQPGRNLGITGSATLVRSLIRENLLDELHLLVHPIVVGPGKRLFEDGLERTALRLLDSRTLSTGVVYLTYGPAGDAREEAA
jgi:dihydrofolate reductase